MGGDPGHLSWFTMSMTSVAPGFCFLCGIEITEELSEHFSSQHQTASAKPKVLVMPWKQRLENIVQAIDEVLQEKDIDAQIQTLDKDVIQELYIVRARLTQLKRTAASKRKETDGSS
jgi:hypothetical protein